MQGKKLVTLGALFTGGVLSWRYLRRLSPFDFEDSVVMITGGSRGLGLVLARLLAVEKAHVVLLARDHDELNRAKKKHFQDAQVLTVACDIREQNQVADAIDRIHKKLGRIDVLINNAGIIQVGPYEHMDDADFKDSLDSHVWGPLYAIRAVVPLMRRQGGGRIVNISSIGGKISVPHLLPYCVGKFGLVGLSDGLRSELAQDNIKVTTVCPGLLRTGSHLNALFKGQRQKEFLWFTLSAAVPGVSVDAERAASQILQACRRGDAELIISPQARLASVFRAVFPEITADLTTMARRLLPSPASEDGDTAKPGHAIEEPAWLSYLTVLLDRAATRNNERTSLSQ